MPTRSRSRRSPRGRTSRRKTTWDQVTTGFIMGAGLNTVVTDITNRLIILTGYTGGTIVRMIGNIIFENSGLAQDHALFDIGVCVVTEDALTAGATPDPEGDPGQDWYYWSHKSLHGQAVDISIDSGIAMRDQFDIRTARRLREGYRLALVIHKSATSQIWNVDVGMRNLWALQ